MSLASRDDAGIFAQPTSHDPAPSADDYVDEDAADWRMYEDRPPTHQQLPETGDSLDFSVAMNTSSLLSHMMMTFGVNASDLMRSPGYLASAGADTFKTVVDNVTLYVTPFIIVVGVVGNALSLAVFSLTYLQRLSSSLYLSMLSVADIVFLLALLVVWLERVDESTDHWLGGPAVCVGMVQSGLSGVGGPVLHCVWSSWSALTSTCSHATAGVRRFCTRHESAASWRPGTSSSSRQSATSSSIIRCARTSSVQSVALASSSAS